jgi:hypothetical protein
VNPSRFLRSLLSCALLWLALAVPATAQYYECVPYEGHTVGEFDSHIRSKNLVPVYYRTSLGLPIEKPANSATIIGNQIGSLPGDPKDPGDEVGVIVIDPMVPPDTKLTLFILISVAISVLISLTAARSMISSAINRLKDSLDGMQRVDTDDD